MRPASIGPVKSMLLRSDLNEIREVIYAARDRGDQSVRPAVMEYLRSQTHEVRRLP
jgi:phosphotransferase system enzyme I (PtsP)